MYRLIRAAIVIAFLAGTATFATAATTDAASCVRFSRTNFNATGNDNYNTNGEWVRIKNYCSTTKSIAGWKIHDYGRKHTYRFPTGVSLRPGYSMTLYTGVGTNTSTRRYWGRSYGAVWNNTAPEYAYLRNSAGTLKSRITEY